MKIEARNISKSFGEKQAIKDVSLVIEPGKILGLLGPNGAGKSTMIKILTGLIKPSSGEIIINGKSYKHFPEKLRNKLGIMPQDIIIWDDLTILENLKFSADLYRLNSKIKSDRVEFLIQSLKLQPEINTLARDLSGGYKRRLNLAISIIHDPEVIFLDEPTPGIDAQSRHLLMSFIDELAQTGKYAIVLTDHYLDEAEKLCDYFEIIDNGKAVTEGTLQQLKRQHGNGNFLTLDLTGDEMQTEKVTEELVARLLVKFPEGKITKGNFVTLTETMLEDLEKVVTIANDAKFPLRSISIKEPSLEDIFLLITGKTVRE